MAFLRIVLFASFVGVTLAAEWNCSTTSGTFTRSTDCVVSSQIVVTGKLNVTGIPDANGVLPKIIGGGSNRLFKVESGGELVVKYLICEGGSAESSSDANGGAIFVSGSNSNLYIENSIIRKCTALWAGGAVYVEEGAVVNICASRLMLNEAKVGGAISVSNAKLVMRNGSFIMNNTAADYTNVLLDGDGFIALHCSSIGTCGGTGGTKVYTPDSQTGYTVTSSVDTYTNSYYFYMEYMFNGM